MISVIKILNDKMRVAGTGLIRARATGALNVGFANKCCWGRLRTAFARPSELQN
jgi:hypothetical protein